jgi:hypothetical protein
MSFTGEAWPGCRRGVKSVLDKEGTRQGSIATVKFIDKGFRDLKEFGLGKYVPK